MEQKAQKLLGIAKFTRYPNFYLTEHMPGIELKSKRGLITKLMRLDQSAIDNPEKAPLYAAAIISDHNLTNVL